MTFEPVELRRPHYQNGWYSRSNYTPQQIAENAAWQALWTEFNEAIDRGDRVFVRVKNSNHKHYGSIALIEERLALRDWKSEETQGFRLGWDKRKNTLSAWTNYYSEIEWLRNYQGPTVYDFDRERGKPNDPKVECLKDRTGKQIKVGDFCCYILHHFQNSGAGIYFGTVTKFTKNGGTAYIKNIKLAESDRVEEKRVTYSENIVVLTKDLLDRMMMARLSLL